MIFTNTFLFRLDSNVKNYHGKTVRFFFFLVVYYPHPWNFQEVWKVLGWSWILSKYHTCSFLCDVSIVMIHLKVPLRTPCASNRNGENRKVILRLLIIVFFQHWFTELPPVLTFELSRFEFNQALGRPEKIHNKLEFPQVLYLDRYGLVYSMT